ncbi:MAG: DUF5655 domain-containing protein [Candidatus Micrarchaeota archaeon]
MASMWKCPRCKRGFEKTNQSHSCTFFPEKNHFKGKGKVSEALYNGLKERIREGVGRFKVDSIPCCIHFVSTFTFTAVRILKDKIRVSFTLDHQVKSSRIRDSAGYSSTRFIHQVDIEDNSQIDKELLDWISQAYRIRKKK